MQAFFFLSVFGLFLATVLGITGNAALNAQQLKELQIQETKAYFRKIAFLTNQYDVMEDVSLSTRTSPELYFKNLKGVQRGANWMWGDLSKDPWGNDIFVFMTRKPYAFVGGGNTVQPYASAFVLASPGPDMKYEKALNTTLKGLNSTKGINAVMRIEAAQGSDDIVYTFSTVRALEERWGMMADNLKKLGTLYLSLYEQKYADADFNNALQDYYDDALSRFLDGSLPSNVTSGNILETWKKPLAAVNGTIVGRLNKNAPDMSKLKTEIASLKVGDNPYITFLKKDLRTTGLNLAVSSQSSVAGGKHDSLTLRLRAYGNVGKAWQNSANTLTYELKFGEN